MVIRALRVSLFCFFLTAFSLSQEAPPVAPLPYDPLELATGPTVVPDTPQKRAVVLDLLEHARQNSAMHTPGTAPFSLKVSFNSVGKGFTQLGLRRIGGNVAQWPDMAMVGTAGGLFAAKDFLSGRRLR